MAYYAFTRAILAGEAIEVFGPDGVMFGTDYGPVPLDPKEHIDIVNALALSPADKEKILWRNADAFFDLQVAKSDRKLNH